MTLLSGHWLSANHMSAANRLLKAQFPGQSGLQDTCILQQKGTWLSSCDGFVQIIYIKPGHWACLSNIYSSPGTVDLFDSLHTEPVENGGIVQQTCHILKSSEPLVTINVANVGIQAGCDDCGLFAIAIAYDLCAQIDPVSKRYTQADMRSHLHSCFNNKILQSFPSTDVSIRERIICHFTWEIYCVCRMTTLSKRMVCCDSCNTWYHEGCVPIPEEVILDDDNKFPWQCPHCEMDKGIMLHFTVLEELIRHFSIGASLQLYVCNIFC